MRVLLQKPKTKQQNMSATSMLGQARHGLDSSSHWHRANVNPSARAVTRGQHVYFHPGDYRPGTSVGDALIAHELAHTRQTRLSDKIATPLTGSVSNPCDAIEKNAEALAW